VVVRHALVAAVISLSLLGPATEASGQPKSDADGHPAFSRVGFTGQLGASFNNPGLQNTLSTAWSKPLSSSSNPLLTGAAVSLGLVSVTTPTMTRIGAWLEYAPLSIVAVRAGFEPIGYFGSFTSLMPFQSYDDVYDKEVLSRKAGTTSGVGLRSYVTPRVQFRAGAVTARISADVEHWRSSADGPYFYEATRDQLLASSGDGLLNMTGIALYEHRLRDGSLSAGVLHGLTRVFSAGRNQSQRLGAIAIRQFSTTRFKLPQPSVTVAVYQYLDDPSKQHSLGGAIAIGFRTGR